MEVNKKIRDKRVEIIIGAKQYFLLLGQILKGYFSLNSESPNINFSS